MNWAVNAYGSERASVDSPWGVASIHRSPETEGMVATVIHGDSVCTRHVNTLEDALYFVAHPFCTLRGAEHIASEALGAA